jgi:HEPN domain-containing protein
MDAKTELAQQFLKLADDDLRLSELIIEDQEPIYWAVAFHAQQCAEKALKCLLTFYDIRAGKTHDISKLILLSLSCCPGLAKFKEQANTLTAYAVDFRYPSQVDEINKKEAIEAVEIARNIFEYILKALPDLTNNGENKTK